MPNVGPTDTADRQTFQYDASQLQQAAPRLCTALLTENFHGRLLC